MDSRRAFVAALDEPTEVEPDTQEYDENAVPAPMTPQNCRRLYPQDEERDLLQGMMTLLATHMCTLSSLAHELALSQGRCTDPQALLSMLHRAEDYREVVNS